MLDVYGSSLCPDCRALKSAFDAHHVEYVFHDITGDLAELKAFLVMRDAEAKFARAKEKGLIGIPIVKLDDGTLTFKWKDLVPDATVGDGECESGACGVNEK